MKGAWSLESMLPWREGEGRGGVSGPIQCTVTLVVVSSDTRNHRNGNFFYSKVLETILLLCTTTTTTTTATYTITLVSLHPNSARVVHNQRLGQGGSVHAVLSRLVCQSSAQAGFATNKPSSSTHCYNLTTILQMARSQLLD